MAKKKQKPSFKDLLPKNKPVPLTLVTKLPYVFDLHWDAKTVKDLFSFGVQNNPDVRRTLAEHGFDVKSLPGLQKPYDETYR